MSLRNIEKFRQSGESPSHGIIFLASHLNDQRGLAIAPSKIA